MKKNLMVLTVLILTGLLAACSLPFSSSSQTSTRSSQSSAFSDPSKLPVESKLAIGILKLEGTEQAVDSVEAKELLPLFNALKTLSTNNNTAAEEITALNKQIKSTMKVEQITAIEKITFTTADLRALMTETGVGNTGPASNNGSSTNASRQGGNNFGPGGPGGGGGIPGISGGVGQTTSTTRVQSTPNAAQAAQTGRRTAGGLNLTFAQPVIDLLKSKISQ